MSPTASPDSELTLTLADQRAVVSPWGASLRRYFIVAPDGAETDIVWGYSGGANKKGGQGDVLIPFPGRVADGRYSFEGESFQLERNDKEGPNAIHGFVRTQPWRVVRQEAPEAVFAIDLSAEHYAAKGYPFSLAITVSYRLDVQGLSCSFEIRNVGSRVAPVGVGFHPYFTVGLDPVDGAEAKIPAAATLEFNDNLVPTGRVLPVAGTDWDFRRSRQIGSRRFNHCYLQLDRDPDGWARASLRNFDNGRTVEVSMDRSFTAIVVYTGDAIPNHARRAFAIEPMTCGTDAFNHPEWGLKRVAVGERFTGRYHVRGL